VLAGLGVWLTYRLGKRLFSPTVGLLAAMLTLSSPFFLMNSGSLLSHPFGLMLSAVFALAWLEAWEESRLPPWLPLTTAAISLGLLALTRPLTAVGVCLPFIPHALYLWFKTDGKGRRRLLFFALGVLALAGLLFVWQFAVSGDPFLNPYTLWWNYDRVGFGPGVGRVEGGHTLHQAIINTRHSLWVGWHDLFGWGAYSWVFLPVGVLAILRLRRWQSLPVMAVFPSLVAVYLAYWIGSSLFGPRYYYEGLFSLTLLSAAGIAFLAGWPTRQEETWPSFQGWQRLRPLATSAILAFLLSANLLFYTPLRLRGMFGLYGVEGARLQPFLTAQAQGLTPALVIVHPQVWTEYGTLLDLQDPTLSTPFIFAISRGPGPDAALAAHFPQRKVFHYYPDQPWVFYISPLSGPDEEP
jgi:4-amino-4-deoxy-L-arabinose transferase-like glycosyltransferase